VEQGEGKGVSVGAKRAAGKKSPRRRMQTYVMYAESKRKKYKQGTPRV
jgi:hypothetical protein